MMTVRGPGLPLPHRLLLSGHDLAGPPDAMIYTYIYIYIYIYICACVYACIYGVHVHIIVQLNNNSINEVCNYKMNVTC